MEGAVLTPAIAADAPPGPEWPDGLRVVLFDPALWCVVRAGHEIASAQDARATPSELAPRGLGVPFS